MNLKIIDNDGFLALVDSNKYQSYVIEDWEFDQLISHFVKESNNGTMIIWRTGDSGDEWNVKVENKKSETDSFREFETKVNVTNGKLYLTEYADLAMSASYPDSKIPSKHNSELKIELENGNYDVIVRQLFNPDIDYEDIKIHFEIVLNKSERNEETKIIDKIMWFN